MIFNHLGWWFPARGDSLISDQPAHQYQAAQRKIIFDHLTSKGCQFRNCVDVGSHIGIYSHHLVSRFKWTHAFEVMPIMRECYRLNITGSNHTLYPYGLGSTDTQARINFNQNNSGGTHASDDGEHLLEIRRLDSFNIEQIDFIKMDVEGYELEVLKGAEQILRKQSPVIQLEMKLKNLRRYGLDKDHIRNYLSRFGYTQTMKMTNDYIFEKNTSLDKT
jgi:FkbM family methyltransferase